MRKYTDSQILRTILKQCRKDVEYQHEKAVELGKKKLELVKKREYFEKKTRDMGWEFKLDMALLGKSFDNITNQIVNHNLASSHSQRIIDEVNDMRKEKKK